MKKKSIQRIAAWLLAAGMMAGTFAQPMAVYAESAASIAASDSTTGDSITADADVVIATPRRSLTPARIRLPPRFLRRIPKLRRTRQAQLRPKPPRPPMPPRMCPPRRPP